jgi:hypothetical protein
VAPEFRRGGERRWKRGSCGGSAAARVAGSVPTGGMERSRSSAAGEVSVVAAAGHAARAWRADGEFRRFSEKSGRGFETSFGGVRAEPLLRQPRAGSRVRALLRSASAARCSCRESASVSRPHRGFHGGEPPEERLAPLGGAGAARRAKPETVPWCCWSPEPLLDGSVRTLGGVFVMRSQPRRRHGDRRRDPGGNDSPLVNPAPHSLRAGLV